MSGGIRGRADERPPNVVYITIDECKANALGCYGNDDAYTPCFDRLAGQGVLFEQAFTTFPKCVPARCALLTGRYPHSEGHRTLVDFELREEEWNVVAELKRHGYATGLVGKNHWMQPGVLERCFDFRPPHNEGIKVQRAMNDRDDPNLYRGLYRRETYEGNELRDAYSAARACEFIRGHKDRPFFLLFDIDYPHPVYTNIRPYIDIIRQKRIALPPMERLEDAPAVLKAYREVYDLEMLGEDEWRLLVEAYYSMVGFADHCVGQVLDALEQEGLADNTIVVFTSDHGDFAGEHGCVEKWDTMFYDCLVRVPLIVRYPGKTMPGLRPNALVSHVDLAPTILSLCGLPLPPALHGKSLAPVLAGEAERHREYVICEGGVEPHAVDRAAGYDEVAPHYEPKHRIAVEHPWSIVRSRMIRTRKWKMIYRMNGVKELYDLEHDPHELADVAAKPENRDILAGLIEPLLHWAIATETEYPPIVKFRS